MFKALGVGGGAVGAVGFSAAIKWVTKDGIGAAGRLFVGGQLSSVFDEDPKRWRMIAEAVTTLGLALEIATQLSPSNFVVLAGAGTLAKAMGKGIGRPCFRVVQTHFSVANNVGGVAAKEEVWEVAAQMVGLAASVALLSLLEAAGAPDAVVPAWTVVQLSHVALRYAALKQLRFPYPNMKRAVAMVKTYIEEDRMLSVDEANASEALLAGPQDTGLSCSLGCSIDEALAALQFINDDLRLRSANGGINDAKPSDVETLLSIYEDEKYVLTSHNGHTYVALWEGAGPLDMLRAVWQAAWLQNMLLEQRSSAAERGNLEAVGSGGDGDVAVLKRSLEEMQRRFPAFAERAKEQGWELHRCVLPLGSYRLTLAP